MEARYFGIVTDKVLDKVEHISDIPECSFNEDILDLGTIEQMICTVE